MRDEIPASRAINISTTEADVRAECEKLAMPISAIETLLSGGTRVVMTTLESAERVRKVFKGKVISGPVRRLAWSAHR